MSAKERKNDKQQKVKFEVIYIPKSIKSGLITAQYFLRLF